MVKRRKCGKRVRPFVGLCGQNECDEINVVENKCLVCHPIIEIQKLTQYMHQFASNVFCHWQIAKKKILTEGQKVRSNPHSGRHQQLQY